MSQNRSLFVVPCYYTGTSFERIYTAIAHVIKECKLPIDIMVGARFDNTLTGGALDDTRYTQAQADILSSMVTKLSAKHYERILFIDFFNPGMELVRYFAEQTEQEIKMAALLHGGTFVDGDIYEAEWVVRSEQLWGTLFDKIFVPSRYAYSQLPAYLADKASIHPWGMDAVTSEGFVKPYAQRTIDVIFPHRLNSDKGIGDLAAIARQLPHVTFVVTSPSSKESAIPTELEGLKNITYITCVSTDDLHEVMSDAKLVLSCAKQELFGYSVAEAVSLGCLPIVPGNQVYTELYSESALYHTIGEATSLISEKLTPSLKTPQGEVITSFRPLLQEFMEMK